MAYLFSLQYAGWAGAQVAPSPARENPGEIVALDNFEVTDRGGSASITDAKSRLAEITGTVSLVDNARVELGRASNAEDVLAFQPGVFAQATSGNGANKISIRGSGLNTFYQGYALGTKFLYDGLPITGPGGTQEDLLNIAGVNYTEVLNGANAFAYAALSLGGAINFVTHTGYTSPGFYGRFEIGSYGYQKEQLSLGGVIGKTDYYVSVLHNKRDGFQDLSENSGRDFILNLGHRFNDRLETRFTVRHRKEKLLNGSTLTLAQIRDTPTLNRVPSGRKKDGTTLLASKTSYTFNDDSKLELGIGYNNYPLFNGWIYSLTPQDWRSEDTNVTLRYLRRRDELFGRPSKTTVALSDTRLLFGDVTGYDRSGNNFTLRQYTKYSGSRDSVLSIGNELQLTDQLGLSTGLSFIEIDRDVHIVSTIVANPTANPKDVAYNDRSLSPRLGLSYRLDPGLQLFGNVSRSIDAPVTWQIGSTGNPYLRNLQPQTGLTAEAGIRGKAGIFEGSLAVYRSWIDDELLTIIVTPATATADAVTANSNASATIHQGIEAGLTTHLWSSRAGGALTLRQSYTLNDFFYEGDPEFGRNQLPSLPVHAYQAELMYQHAKGFYAGLNLRAASSYYVDFANTLKAPGYAVYGAKLGFEAQRWKFFLDLRNLGDKHYATAANTAFNLRGVDSPNFYPGDDFNLTSGVSFRF